MVPREQIEALRLKKKRLLLESQVNRQLMALECLRLQPTLLWADRGYAFVKMVRPYWKFVVPILSFFLFKRRRKGKKRGFIMKGLFLAQMARRLWRGYRFYRSNFAAGFSGNGKPEDRTREPAQP